MTNCSELLFATIMLIFDVVGFYNSALMIVDTPKGDLMLLMIVGGLA